MRKFLPLSVLIFSFLFISSKAVLAQDFNQQKTVVISKDETIDDNPYFTGGDTVQIDGTVNGDVYAAGGDLTINGTINGDLIVAGGIVRVGGKVRNNVKIAGGQITVTGELGDSLTVAGGNITLEKTSKVSDYALIAGGNIAIYGPINGDLKLAGGNVIIDSEIGKNVDAGVGVLRIGPSAVIKGSLTYMSEEQATVDPSAKIAGEVKYQTPPPKPEVVNISQESLSGLFTGIKFTTAILSVITTIIIGLLLIKFAPNLMDKTKNNLETNPWRSLGFGALALFVTPLIFIILLILVVSIPIAFFMITLFGYLTYLAKFFVIYWLSKKLFKKSSVNTAFILTVIVYVLVTLIPFIGGMVSFATLLFGLGAGVLGLQIVYKEAVKSKVI